MFGCVRGFFLLSILFFEKEVPGMSLLDAVLANAAKVRVVRFRVKCPALVRLTRCCAR